MSDEKEKYGESSYLENESSSKKKLPGQRQGVTEEVDEVTDGIRMGNARVPRFLIITYILLGIWGIGYAFTAQPLNERVGETRVASGEEIFQRSCIGCHGIEQAKTGPALGGVSERLTDEEIHNVLLNGQGAMPALPNLGLNTQQIKVIEEYIKTL